MMQDLVRTKSAASKGQAFDFNNLSPEGQRAYVEASGNSVAFEPPTVKGGKYKVRSEAQQAKIRAKNGEAMHKGLEAFRTSNPDVLRIKDAQGNDIGGLSVDADGNYVGQVSDAILDYFVKSGHIDKVEAERIKILQQAARGETPSNVFEFTDYTGATMNTGIGENVRAVSPNVPTKSRLVIVTDFSVKISGKDYGFYAHTLDYRHLELRADNSWKDPKVRAEWGDDRNAFISDLFRYFKNASLPDGQRLPSAQLWSTNGEYKRNIMHDVSGIQTPASGTINTANAPIAGDMFSTFRKFRTDRMTQERMSGEKIDLRGDNAIDYIRHNMMPSEMSGETTPNGKIWTHPSGYKFLQVEGGIKAVKPDGTIIGKFGSMEEAVKKADAIYQKENPNGKPIASVDNIRNEPADAPETQAQYTKRKIDSFYERPENALDLMKDGDFIQWAVDKDSMSSTGEYIISELEKTVKTIIDDANKPNQGDRFATDFIDYPAPSEDGNSSNKTIGDVFKEFYKEQFFREQEANNPTFVSGLSVALDKILPANVNKEGTIQASRLINLMKSASGGDIGKILTEANSIGFTEYLKSKGQQRISVSEIKDFIDKNGIRVSIDPRTDIRGNEWNGGGFETSRYVAEGKKDGYYTFVARINPEQAHGVEGHFGGDTIVHIRATIRTDAQGRKVLFIEEIQSINTNAGVPSADLKIKLETEVEKLKLLKENFTKIKKNFVEEQNNVIKKYNIDWTKESPSMEVQEKYQNDINAVNKKYEDKYTESIHTQEHSLGSISRKISEIESKLAKKKSDKPLQDFNETVKIASRTIMRKAVELGAERVVLVRPEDMHPDVSVNAEGERFVDALYGRDIPAMMDAELKKYGQQLKPADNISKSKAYETSDTHDTHILLSESLGYDITPEMKQKAGRSQTFMMPSEQSSPIPIKDFISKTEQEVGAAWSLPFYLKLKGAVISFNEESGLPVRVISVSGDKKGNPIMGTMSEEKYQNILKKYPEGKPRDNAIREATEIFKSHEHKKGEFRHPYYYHKNNIVSVQFDASSAKEVKQISFNSQVISSAISAISNDLSGIEFDKASTSALFGRRSRTGEVKGIVQNLEDAVQQLQRATTPEEKAVAQETINSHIEDLRTLKDELQDKHENTPEAFQETEAYTKREDAMDALDDAITDLENSAEDTSGGSAGTKNMMPAEGEYRSGDNYWKAKDNKFEGVDADGRTYRLAYVVVNGKVEHNPESINWMDIGHGSGNPKDIKRFGAWAENLTDTSSNKNYKKDEIITKPLGNNFHGNHEEWFHKEFKYSEDEPTTKGRYELPIYDSKGKLITRGKISIVDSDLEKGRNMSSFYNLKKRISEKLKIKSDDVDAYIFGSSLKITEELGVSPKDQLPIKFMPAEQAEAWRNFQSEKVSDGNSIFKNAMNYVIIQANNKFKVYNPQKALLGIYNDLDGAKRRVQREEPKPR
jgi:hypothetical protein